MTDGDTAEDHEEDKACVHDGSECERRAVVHSAAVSSIVSMIGMNTEQGRRTVEVDFSCDQYCE